MHFSAVCTQVADPLKTQNVQLLQLTDQADVLVERVQSREKRKNPAEVCGNPAPIHYNQWQI